MFVVGLAVRLTIERYAAALSDPDRPRRDLGPWQIACETHGLAARVEMTGVEHEAASAAVAERLGVDVGAAVVRRSRRMWAADQSLQLQSAWMPAELVEGTPLAGPDNVVGGVYAAMTRLGFAPARAVEEVSTRQPTDAEREQLSLTRAVPVMDVWRTTYTAAGRPIEVLHVVAARCTYVYEVPITG
jgi:GntR family transcriptional regulator